jgi:hypothetical protein
MKNPNIVPCSSYTKNGDKPGFRYNSNEYPEYNFPCFSYDPMNKTSKKAAMKAAILSGEEELERIKDEVIKDLAKEKVKEGMKGAETKSE